MKRQMFFMIAATVMAINAIINPVQAEIVSIDFYNNNSMQSGKPIHNAEMTFDGQEDDRKIA